MKEPGGLANSGSQVSKLDQRTEFGSSAHSFFHSAYTVQLASFGFSNYYSSGSAQIF